MTLKLVSKSLPNKYAEQLFKNEISYGKDINKQYDRIKLDYLRNTQMIDAGYMVFINQIRQKRAQWRKDDLKFRENYKSLCKNTYLRYLDSNILPNIHKKPFQEPKQVIETTFTKKKVRSHSISGMNTENEKNIFIIDHEDSLLRLGKSAFASFNNLNNIYNNNGDDDKPFSHGAYSICDKDFIDKFPDKIELTATDVGKEYIKKKREEYKILKKQKQKYAKIQKNALDDTRYKKLVSVLD